MNSGITRQNIKTAGQMLYFSKVSLAKKTDDSQLSAKERYLLKIMQEHFREIDFYYAQLKTDNTSFLDRLHRSLLALDSTIKKSCSDTREKFFKSSASDMECLWFIIGSLCNYPNVESEIYLRKFLYLVENSYLLTNATKQALIIALASSLLKPITIAYSDATHATRLGLIEILRDRKESVLNFR